MNRTSWIAFFAIVAAFSLPVAAQFGLNSTPPVVIRNATVFIDGEMVENCDVMVRGKRIRAVGPDLEAPSDAVEVDGKGKFVLPTLIDLDTKVGTATRSQSQKPRHLSLDAIDPYRLDAWVDALEAGVGYAYVSGVTSSGAGGRGRAVALPSTPMADLDKIQVEGSDAIHVKLGVSANGPIARRNEVLAFGKYVESAKKYRESWEKYEESLEKYEKDLAEYAKKAGKGKGKSKPSKSRAKGEAKKGGAPSKPSSKSKSKPKSKKSSAPRRLVGGFNFGLPLPGVEVCDDENCDILGLHDDDDHTDHAFVVGGADDHEGHDHPAIDPTTGFPLYRDPSVVAIFEDRVELSPRLTHFDDGTEPHLVWRERPSVRVAAQKRKATCPHCGAGDPFAPEHIAHLQPFPDDTFENIGDSLAARYLEELGIEVAEEDHADDDDHDGDHHDGDHDDDHDDDDHGDEDHDDDHEEGGLAFGRADPKKPTKGSSSKDKKSGGKPKLPKRPAVNPDLDQMSRVLAGEIGIRIEVHRAEDILALLKILDDVPMRAALVGASEGRFVAKQIAEAGVPVLIDAAPTPPAQEPAPAGGGGGFRIPTRFPGGFVRPNFGGRGARGFRLPAQGWRSSDNAARMADAGVTIAITSGGDASASLLDRAAYAISQGLDENLAIQAITAAPAGLLRMEKVGRLRRGFAASMVVFDGNPFLATSRVERVYRDGEVVFKK